MYPRKSEGIRPRIDLSGASLLISNTTLEPVLYFSFFLNHKNPQKITLLGHLRAHIHHLVLKQKQKLNEDTLQSEPREREQVFSHEVESSSEEEPFRMARREPRFQTNTNDFRVEVPEFEGKLDLEEFLEWLCTVERVFECKDVFENKRVKLVALRLRKYASLWWTNLCAKWVRTRKAKICT